MNEELKSAILSVEKGNGIRLPNRVVYEVLRYSLSKLEYVRKDISYLPILFENELRDYVAREAINKRGGTDYVYRVRDDTMPQQLSKCKGLAQSLSLQILR